MDQMKPSPDNYRQTIAKWVWRVEVDPCRENIAALRAISQAAQIDKQLENLSDLLAKVRQLEGIIEELTKVQADDRHNQSARRAN